jgi:hypothetical protein
MDVAEVTGCHCHEGGTLCPHCAEQVRRLMRGQEHNLLVQDELRSVPEGAPRRSPATAE